MISKWLAERTNAFDSSGIRRVFDLATSMHNPINLSIGQPDFDVPSDVRLAAVDAINSKKNSYTLTQGIPVLREKLQAEIDSQYNHKDRRVFVTSGTSGGLLLALFALVNPGDEVIVFDPYFVMYEPLVSLVGGTCVFVDTYPDFHINVSKVEPAISARTKLILFNSPANPTGVVTSKKDIQQIAELAARHNVVLLSDEIYKSFCYDEPFVSPATFNEHTLVLDGFSKSHGMTGWRLGYAHGPATVIEAMIKIQQYTFVCAPQPAQWAGPVAMDADISEVINSYREKRNRLLEGLAGKYDIERPGGAFYIFPRVPEGIANQFFARAMEHNLLIIPGNIFSRHDTHFRISYAASDETLERGIKVLRHLA
jgi:aspartate aminotransferase/aminotransferase